MTTKIISWNFYYDLKSEQVKNAENLLGTLDQDIVCIQEHSEIKLKNFTKILLQLPSASVSIFFKTSKYKIIKSFKFGFDDNYKFYKDNGDQNPNNDIKRPIIILKLQDLEINKNIIVGCIWAPHNITKKNKEFSEKINKYINILYENNDTIILCGDFNELYEHINGDTLNFFNNNSQKYKFNYIANGLTCCRDLPGKLIEYKPNRIFDMFISNIEI